MELLFESRLDIVRVGGKVYPFQIKPTLHPEPVVRPDSPSDRTGASIYGTVLHDGGMYRMWYQAWPENWDGWDASSVGYAESDDGIEWRKPKMNLVPAAGAPGNLCNLFFHSPSVFIDPQAAPDRRYRATGYVCARTSPWKDRIKISGYYTAHSADGLSWEPDAATPAWSGSDVITSAWHPGQDRAIVALKYLPRYRGIPRRSVWNAELKKGEWSGAGSAIVPDDYDDVNALARGFASADYYGMGMMPAGGGTAGFLWVFRHSLPRTAGNEIGVFGKVDVSLVYQAGPGDRWVHMPGRPDFISHTDLPWSQGGIYTASCAVDCGRETRLYFSGSSYSHGWYLDAQWKRIDALMDQMKQSGMAQIGFASWPKDRLFGFRGDPFGVVVIKPREQPDPCRLLLNYRTARNGCLKVQQVDNAGKVIAEALPLAGDELAKEVEWQKPAPLMTGVGRQIRIYLEQAELYAYDLKQA